MSIPRRTDVRGPFFNQSALCDCDRKWSYSMRVNTPLGKDWLYCFGNTPEKARAIALSTYRNRGYAQPFAPVDFSTKIRSMAGAL